MIPPLPRPIGPAALAVGPVTGKYPAVWHVSLTCALSEEVHLSNLTCVAHAHGYYAYGLICVLPNFADDEVVQAHEYAHLLIEPLRGRREWAHGPRWRKALADLGFPEEAAEYVGWRD